MLVGPAANHIMVELTVFATERMVKNPKIQILLPFKVKTCFFFLH